MMDIHMYIYTFVYIHRIVYMYAHANTYMDAL